MRTVPATSMKKTFIPVCIGLAFAAGLGLAASSANALCMARMPTGYYEAHRAMRQGNTSEARRLFRQAATTPGQVSAWMAGALSAAAWRAKNEGKIDRAAELYRSALRENPSYTHAATAVVTLFENAGRLHDALLEVRALPKSIARSDEIRRIEARILGKLGDHAAAKRLLTKLSKG